MPVIKKSNDCLFLLMIRQQAILKFLLILSKKYFLPRVKIENATLKLMEETFMISQLMTQLSNTMKSEKYQQEKIMITRMVVY